MTVNQGNNLVRVKAPYGRWFWILICTAFVIGLAVVFMHRMDTPGQLTADALDYHNLAVQLLKEHSYGSTYRVPAYPALLALVYAISGLYMPSVYLMNVLLFVASLVLIYNIAYYLTRNNTTSLITLALCLLWPPFWRSMTDVLTEPLAGFLMCATVWQLLVCREKAQIGRCALAGLLLAIATLTKAVLIPYIVFAALIVLRPGRNRKPAWAGAGVLLLVVMVCLGAWTVRNYKVTGEIIPVATGGGFNFWLGNWPPYYHQVWEWKAYPPEVQKAINGKTEVEQDRIFTQETIRGIQKHPLLSAQLLVQKFSDLWLAGMGRDPASMSTHVSSIGQFGIPKMSLLSLPLFIMAIIGYAIWPRDVRMRALPMTVLLLWWTAAYVLTTVAPARYVLPVQTFELLLAAVAVSRAIELVSARRSMMKSIT